MHFVGSRKSEHPHHPAYVPSIFPTHKQAHTVQDDSRFQRLNSRKNQLQQRQVDNSEDNYLDEQSAVGDFGLSKPSTQDISCQTDKVDDILFTNEVLEKKFFCCFYIREYESKQTLKRKRTL